MREWRDIHSQLLTVVAEHGWRLNEAPATYEQVHLSLLAGLLGNIGCKSDDEDWFFLTPVFYSLEMFGSTATVLGYTFYPAQLLRWLNPMASIIDGYRTVLWGTYDSGGPVSMYPPYLLRTFVTSVIVFILGYAVFNRLNPLFGEKL